jgi:carboxymethylenebutenolidase
MCYGPDSHPPIAPIAGAAVDSQILILTCADGTRSLACVAEASEPTGAGILILPDVRGLHAFYEELALRFAEAGIDALVIDYFGRTAGTEPRTPDFDFMAHVGQARYEQLALDMAAGADELRDRRPHVRRLFTVGFCFGGRLAFVSATRPELDLAGVIGFYGVPHGAGRAGIPAPTEVARQMRAPVLGLFGGDDPAIPAEAVADFERALADAGVEHELVAYPGAPHSFFDRKAEQFAAESADAWRRVLAFVRSRTTA